MTDFTPETPVLTPIRDHAAELAKAEAGVAEMAAKRNNRWYPKYHIASNGGWINDPNGLCFYKGRWHVFYRLHPYGTQWGPMHWGHVSSEDMVTWHREPIAFAPSIEADRDGVFSGSAVVSDDGETLYRQCSTGHHHHLVCRACGRTVEVAGPTVERWADSIAAEHGFVDVAHTLEIFGTCGNCST